MRTEQAGAQTGADATLRGTLWHVERPLRAAFSREVERQAWHENRIPMTSMRPLLTRGLALAGTLLPVLAACGGSVTAGQGEGDAGHHGDAAQSGDAGACGAAEVCCGLDSTGCMTDLGNAVCGATGWTCPSGETASAGCPRYCIGMSMDGGAPDVGTTGTLFSCGTGGPQCDSATQYCFIVEGGAMLPDASPNRTGNCDAVPSSCLGASLSCACLMQSAAGQCTDVGGEITMTVFAP